MTLGAGPGSRRLVGQPLLYAISCFASLGVFLFGYDQGVMSGLLTGPYFKAYFHDPDAIQIGTMVAILEIGAFVTSLASGYVGDRFGRRWTLCRGAILFTIGGLVQTFATSLNIMCLGRIFSGFGVGLLSSIVPIYQSEVSPAEHRGALACMEFTWNVFGYAASVWLDYGCSYIESDMSWRIPLFMQSVIGTILAVGSAFLPESPRWLLDAGDDDVGLQVLVDLHGGDPDNSMARAEFTEIQEVVAEARRSGSDRSYRSMWRQYKRRVLLAMSAQALAQLDGINIVSYYAPRIFEQGGWHGRQAILMTGINALIYVASTIPPWYLVDRWGRRKILLSGAVVMSLSLFSVGWWMWRDVVATPNAVVICVIIYNAAFGYSFGPIPWLYPPEIMPLAYRATGVSLSTATNWAFNWLIGEVTPTLQELMGWRMYPMFGIFCACSFVIVYFLYPETMGVPLEEMDSVFGEARKDLGDGLRLGTSATAAYQAVRTSVDGDEGV